VRVKLLNSTLNSPDELTGTPSSVAPIFEFARVLVDNETWSIPFVWRVLNIAKQSNNLLITGLSINQTAITGNLGQAISGSDFRLVFELWYYDQTGSDLVFTWPGVGGVNNAAWIQMWFNMATT